MSFAAGESRFPRAASAARRRSAGALRGNQAASPQRPIAQIEHWLRIVGLHGYFRKHFSAIGGPEQTTLFQTQQAPGALQRVAVIEDSDLS